MLLVLGTAACADAEKARLLATTQPTYDPATGRLIEITYDADQDGQIDTWTEMDGTHPLRSRIDRNQDGRIDRWEYYDDEGLLAKVGFSRSDDGTPDAWAFAGTDGTVQRIEVSSTGDELAIDRWEYYDASRNHPGGGDVLVRVEEDTDGDSRPDKWETYDQGAIVAVAFDEDRDGRADRTLNYRGSEATVIDAAQGVSETGRR